MTALNDFCSANRWVAWRPEQRDGKWTKLPYFAQGRLAAANNPATWRCHDEAAMVAEAIVNGHGGGIGIMLGPFEGDCIAGIDLDKCRDPETGAVDPWAQDVIDRFDTYAEISSSRFGIKLYFLSDDLDAVRAIMGTSHGRQFRRPNGGEHGPAIELYTSNRYFAVTWECLEDAPTELRVVPLDDLRWLIEQAGPSLAGKANEHRTENSSAGAGDILDRLRMAAKYNKVVDAALRGAATGKGGSRSEGAFGLGAALKRAGWSFSDMCATLRACPATKEWASEKSERDFERIWQRSSEENTEDHPGEHDDGDSSKSATWPEPVDILADRDAGAPILTQRHVPDAIWPFIADTAERMGVATSSVALSAIVSCASVISDDWQVQPKRSDYTWTEAARLWGAIVGPPSILKSPVIAAATAPVVTLEVAASRQHSEQMAAHRTVAEAWKANGKKDPEPKAPRRPRYLVESATIEALSEVLRDDQDGKQYAPLGKVLARQDELAEFIANQDRYSSGKGGGDRGAYLRAYNGGRFTIDRITRGSFAANSWSVCLLGGIQPDPIQRIANQTVDDGLLQRLMLDVPAPQGAGLDRAPDRDALEAYRSLFPALAALRPARTGIESQFYVTVALHADAHEAREDINALARALAAQPDTSSRLQSTFGKWPGLFARLCLTFHLIEIAAAKARGDTARSPDVIPTAIAAKVRAYMRQGLAPSLFRAEAICFRTHQSGHATWIAGYILAGHLDRITARDIVQDYRPLRAPERRDELTSVMASLGILGWVEAEATRNLAKPATAWAVNPAVHGVFAAQAHAERYRRDEVREAISRHVANLRGC